MSTEIKISHKNIEYPVPVTSNMLVKELIDTFEKIIDLDGLHLKYDAVLLLTEKPIRKYLVTAFKMYNDKRTIDIDINDLSMEMSIQNPNIKQVLNKDVTISELKSIIASKGNFKNENWVVKKNETVIPDEDLLRSHLEVKTFTALFQPYVVLVNHQNSNYSITCTKDMTVVEFKKAISEKINQPIDEFSITYSGEVLEYEREMTRDLGALFLGLLLGVDLTVESAKDREKRIKIENRTLGSYEIGPNAVVQLIARLPGGIVSVYCNERQLPFSGI